MSVLRRAVGIVAVRLLPVTVIVGLLILMPVARASADCGMEPPSSRLSDYLGTAFVAEVEAVDQDLDLQRPDHRLWLRVDRVIRGDVPGRLVLSIQPSCSYLGFQSMRRGDVLLFSTPELHPLVGRIHERGTFSIGRTLLWRHVERQWPFDRRNLGPGYPRAAMRATRLSEIVRLVRLELPPTASMSVAPPSAPVPVWPLALGAGLLGMTLSGRRLQVRRRDRTTRRPPPGTTGRRW